MSPPPKKQLLLLYISITFALVLLTCSPDSAMKGEGIPNGSTRSIKVISLIYLTIHTTYLPLLIRYIRIRKTDQMFLGSSMVVFNELAKVFFCIIIIIGFERSLIKFLSLIKDEIINKPMMTLKASIPGLLYTVQNNLYFVALSNLSPAVFCVTYQLKILTTAFFSVVILKKELRKIQYISLVMLLIGVAMVEMESHKEIKATSPDGITTSPDVVRPTPANQIKPRAQNHMVGMVAVLIMSCSSGLAGVYTEKIFKESGASVWLENIRFGLFLIPLGVIGMLVNDWSSVWRDGMLAGYDVIIFIIIVLGSIGGLSIALVMKYAGNIPKTYAQCLAIIFTAIGSVIFFDLKPTALFALGCVIVMAAILLYNIGFGPATKTALHTVVNAKVKRIDVDEWKYFVQVKRGVNGVANGHVQSNGHTAVKY